MKRILVSKCLLDYPYRYDGKDVRIPALKELLKDFEVISICPEVELLNLPVPRPRLKFVPDKGSLKLLREDTKEELGELLREKSREFLNQIGEIHGAILKSKSPSCGVGDAKVYKCLECEEEAGRAWGIFAKELKKRFPNIPIITENDIDLLSQVFKSKG